jgi:tetratricopeptide (TPR) repeat protein
MPKKEQPKEVPRPKKPEPDLPRPPAPEDDPRDEHARLVRAGRSAFADQEYGRAAQRFRQAVRLLPAEPEPYFLLAQALLAQGSYYDAFDAIRDGMRRRPDWPTARFRPIELYGRHLDEYTALLRATERALARFPRDPELLFVRGYVLWFDGRKEEARPYFRKALPHAANRDAIDRFLRAMPDEPGL